MNSTSLSTLTVLLWNSNGVQTHRNELMRLLHDRNIDIALIAETRLTQRKNLTVTGYRTYRTDHPDGRAHGGTAILIRNSLSHHALPYEATDYLQATTISLSTSSFPLTLAAVYCPPNKSISPTQFSQFFDSLGPHFLAGGDYNSKHLQWGSRTTNSRGRSLYTSLTTRQLTTISPNTPTYWPADENRVPDLIDFFVCKRLNPFHSSTSTLHDLSSDHSPVLLTLSLQPLLL